MSARSDRTRRSSHRTLLSRILLWMIVPLFIMWTIGIVITYFISLNLANSPYDRTLASHLRLLRHEVEQQKIAQGIVLSGSARTVLAGSADETPIQWQILDANGHLMAGDARIPTPENWGYDIDAVRFRNAELNHHSIRMAYVWGGRDQNGTGFLAVVAEPSEARATLQQEILTGMLTPQLIILPLAAMLAGLGLTQGLEPLSLLQELMRRRKPSDLSPIRDDLAPAEIVPLIDAMNDVLQRLSASIDSQRRFVANAAHQLKTPLAGIRTQCELAMRERDPQELRASLQQLITGSQRATRLVNQLLLLARAESIDPNQARTTESLDLAALAEDCTGGWVQTALERGLDLGFEATGEPLPVFGNRAMIRELLNNLIDNALLYTPAGGQVTVRALTANDDVCLEVQDTGPGIPAEERSKVFDRFYRILGQQAEGSGLGLAIVQEIAEHHRATVGFLPPGNHRDPTSAGTRLRVSFPRDRTRP
ncbi:MAG: sensor histidine kinase [Castellaniella sp.]|uniref:sensor histidine kinase n=1 Tax=Castellaniella sp. TaxID=1955812 RepID=UPI00121C7C94|nr:sensor histidine kinase [Castellaniella sp.]TAN28659.1 MAG: sensor histidine kinase [Castellaniella sp.]